MVSQLSAIVFIPFVFWQIITSVRRPACAPMGSASTWTAASNASAIQDSSWLPAGRSASVRSLVHQWLITWLLIKWVYTIQSGKHVHKLNIAQYNINIGCWTSILKKFWNLKAFDCFQMTCMEIATKLSNMLIYAKLHWNHIWNVQTLLNHCFFKSFSSLTTGSTWQVDHILKCYENICRKLFSILCCLWKAILQITESSRNIYGRNNYKYINREWWFYLV